MKTLLSFSLTTALLVANASATTDPFLGQWKLDVQRSHYPAGTCPKEMVIEMADVKQGIHYHSHTIYAGGRTAQAEYVADYKGKQAAVMGTRGFLLPVTLKRLDARTVVASYSRGQQVVATSRRVLSGDGRLMTITTKSRDQSGKNVITVGVYEKE
jgi:hypothetical protein